MEATAPERRRAATGRSPFPPTGAAPLLLVLAACTPPPGSPEGGGDPAECSDAIDNDTDGLVDCADPDCDAACAGSDHPAAGLELQPGNPRADLPGTPPWFIDRTEELGLAYVPLYDDYFELAALIPGDAVKMFGGFVLDDLDGDGHLDYLSMERTPLPKVWFGDGQLGFVPQDPAELGFQPVYSQITGASAADWDADGDRDVIISGHDTRLYLNDGTGHFSDRTDLIGFVPEDGSLEATPAWTDFDRDGDVDVFIPGHPLNPAAGITETRDRLLATTADGGFENLVDWLIPEDLDGEGWMAGWFDADLDGWEDLYVVQSMSPDENERPSVFIRNLGGPAEDGGWAFTPDGEAGLEVMQRSMGAAIGDMDDDGDFDVHVTNIGPTFLARNDGPSGFVDVSLTIDPADPPLMHEFSWGSVFVDVDNDGHQELYTAFGVDAGALPFPGLTFEESTYQPDRLWSWDPEAQIWTNRGAEVGLGDPDCTRAALAVDVDRDGCQDIWTWRLLSGPRFFHSNCGDGGWVIVRTRMEAGGNVDALGARVEAWDGGVLLGSRRIEIGSTLFSSRPPEVHFGLGERTAVDLVVYWPDGAVTRNDRVPSGNLVLLSR